MAVAHIQNANNMPQISDSSHQHSVYTGSGLAIDTLGGTSSLGLIRQAEWANQLGFGADQIGSGDSLIEGKKKFIDAIYSRQQEIKVADPKRRLVKVVIIDPDDKVPLDKCLLHCSDEQLTDLTDQELFFEIDIKNILDKHNEVRTEIVDKTIKERTEYLEPVKVRDLRMVVVTVASF